MHPRFERPRPSEIARWILQPSNEARAAKFIADVSTSDGFRTVSFDGIPDLFYFPENTSGKDFCQKLDECFNAANWHRFFSDQTPVGPDGTVIDCGAAEGVFSFRAGRRAKRVYTIEPVPSWSAGLERAAAQFPHLEVMHYGVGAKSTIMRMTDAGIYSRLSGSGNIEVKVERLDNLFRTGPFTFLKADMSASNFRCSWGEKISSGGAAQRSQSPYTATRITLQKSSSSFARSIPVTVFPCEGSTRTGIRCRFAHTDRDRKQ